MRNIFYAILFSGLGVFSYLLLVNYTNMPTLQGKEIPLLWICAFMILALNVLGFFITKMSEWIGAKSLFFNAKWRIIVLYCVVALLLFLLNYGLLSGAKFLAGSTSPFHFNLGGVRILLIVWLVELVVVGLLLVNNSVHNALQYQKKANGLQEENDKARYIALQNQLNPHFLFNSLNTLIAEIEYDPHNAVEFTRNLSDVYRYVLQCQDKTTVTLREELDFMDSYIFLHRVRLGDYINIENEIPEAVMNATLPPLTLQLLIENVIKHNSITSTKPMTLTLKIENNRLVVSNSVAPKISCAVSGRGLQNLSKRYQLLLNRDIEIMTDSDRFTVAVPLD